MSKMKPTAKAMGISSQRVQTIDGEIMTGARAPGFRSSEKREVDPAKPSKARMRSYPSSPTDNSPM